MLSKVRRHGETVVVAMVTAGVLVAAPASAHGVRHAKFAHVAGNARAVDGKSAVGSAASNAQAANKLVTTDSTGHFLAKFIPKVDDSDRLDGMDSSEFAAAGHNHDSQYAAAGHNHDSQYATPAQVAATEIRTDHNFQAASDCDVPNTDNHCAEVIFTVPPGRTYLLSMWSSFTAVAGGTNDTIEFCPSVRLQGTTAAVCRSPFGFRSRVTVPAGQYNGASTSGETVPLSAGTYVASTVIRPGFVLTFGGNYDAVITKILLRDVTNSLP